MGSCSTIIQAYGGKGAVLCTHGGTLPFTGFDLAGVALAAILVLFLGILAMGMARR